MPLHRVAGRAQSPGPTSVPAGMAESADAADLKSADPFGSSGFESRSPHHLQRFPPGDPDLGHKAWPQSGSDRRPPAGWGGCRSHPVLLAPQVYPPDGCCWWHLGSRRRWGKWHRRIRRCGSWLGLPSGEHRSSRFEPPTSEPGLGRGAHLYKIFLHNNLRLQQSAGTTADTKTGQPLRVRSTPVRGWEEGSVRVGCDNRGNQREPAPSAQFTFRCR